jgi:beta-galactosidase GanA
MDKYSLMIDGQRFSLWGGEFHYWRLPSPDLWLDVLQKLKANGYNAATIYFHWGYHSPAPGVYDFAGIRDVDRLLDMAKQVGLYVIARPGPHINAETDGGGFPAWLDRLPGTKRTTDPAYLAYADEWLSQIDPILARHQLTNGTGTIILNQVENEFTDSSDAGRAYMQHLIDKFHSDGITVPLTGNHWNNFNSGSVGVLDVDGWDLYPQGFDCSNPTTWAAVPDLSWLRASLTDRPLYFAEFQGGSFDYWGGPGYDKCRQLTGPDFEKVFTSANLAIGSTMQSFYMTFGGTSWGYLPYPGVYTSYDYGAAITESRQATAKLDQQRLTGTLLNTAIALAKTDALPVPAYTNPALWVRGRMNPDNKAQVYFIRHADGTSTNFDQTQLTLDLTGGTSYTHDDADPALQYNGSWTHASGQSWTASDYQGTESFSSTAGDSVSVSFTGSIIRWVSSIDWNHGIATVSIDGAQVATVDTFGTGKQAQVLSYQVPQGDHTLTITVTGQQNPSAYGSYVVIDAIDIPPVATGQYYATVPQQPGTAITINGRDAKLLLAGYPFGGQQLVYSTSQLLTHATLDGRDVAVLYAPTGEDGETVLRYTSQPTVKVLAGSVVSTWDAGRGDLRLNYSHSGLAKVLVTGGGRPDLVLLLAEQGVAVQFWRFDTSVGTVLARAPTLVRGAGVSHGQLALSGDTSADTTLEIYAPSVVRQVTWNNRIVGARGTVDLVKGPLTVSLAGPKPVTTLPALAWRYRFETPEADPAFDDFGWTLADHLTSQNLDANTGNPPVLGADEYGFHYGHVWYRGHFIAAGSESKLSLGASTGGNGVGQYAVWLNGTYLGTGDGSNLFTIAPAALRTGQDNVVSVLVADIGHDEGASKAQRGLTSAKLYGSQATIAWRVQGNLGGEDLVDPIRGPLNNGGLYGERAGWSLPGFPDRDWQSVSLPYADSQPGVAWYRSQFRLDLPQGQDVPIALRLSDDPTRHYRAQIFLNGWNLGLYVNDKGPQHDFVLPAGLLRANGDNTLALAVWSNDATGGLGTVSLVVQGNYRGGVPVSDVVSPPFLPWNYLPTPAPAHLTLTGPDEMKRGNTATVVANLSVPANRLPVFGGAITLSVPSGWQVAGNAIVPVRWLMPGQSATARWTITAPSGDQPSSTMLVARATLNVFGPPSTVEAGKTITILAPPPSGDVYASDLPFQATNGWGPVERDLSNGDAAAGDGHPITLGGTVYSKGLGTNAPSDITFYVGGNCTSFTSVVGVDAETGGWGSVRFHVLADNVEVASTGILYGTSAPLSLTADITGAEWLDLVVDDAGDGNGLDHGDWANAMIHCQ